MIVNHALVLCTAHLAYLNIIPEPSVGRVGQSPADPWPGAVDDVPILDAESDQFCSIAADIVQANLVGCHEPFSIPIHLRG